MRYVAGDSEPKDGSQAGKTFLAQAAREGSIFSLSLGLDPARDVCQCQCRGYTKLHPSPARGAQERLEHRRVPKEPPVRALAS